MLNNSILFKKQILSLWADTILVGPHPEKNYDALLVQTKNGVYYYDPEKVTQNQHIILSFLNELHILDQHLLADGTKWTELKQPIELLMSMGSALLQNMQKNNKITR